MKWKQSNMHQIARFDQERNATYEG